MKLYRYYLGWSNFTDQHLQHFLLGKITATCYATLCAFFGISLIMADVTEKRSIHRGLRALKWSLACLATLSLPGSKEQTVSVSKAYIPPIEKRRSFGGIHEYPIVTPNMEVGSIYVSDSKSPPQMKLLTRANTKNVFNTMDPLKAATNYAKEDLGMSCFVILPGPFTRDIERPEGFTLVEGGSVGDTFSGGKLHQDNAKFHALVTETPSGFSVMNVSSIRETEKVARACGSNYAFTQYLVYDRAFSSELFTGATDAPRNSNRIDRWRFLFETEHREGQKGKCGIISFSAPMTMKDAIECASTLKIPGDAIVPYRNPEMLEINRLALTDVGGIRNANVVENGEVSPFPEGNDFLQDTREITNYLVIGR